MRNPKRERNSDPMALPESPYKRTTLATEVSIADLFSDASDTGFISHKTLPAVDSNNFSAKTKSFLFDHAEVFDDLVNLSSPKFFVDYLDENPTSYQYYRRLYKALSSVIDKHTDTKILRNIKNRKTGERRKRIDVANLIKKLNSCSSEEDREFINVLNEGIASWRLLKLVDLYYLAEKDNKKSIMTALVWLEKRREFIKRCMTQDPSLMKWLNQPEQAQSKKALMDFTKDLEEKISTGALVNTLPRFMDVRKLWHALEFNNLIDPSDYINNAYLLQEQSNSSLRHYELEGFFLEVFPCPWTCFLEAINGLNKKLRLGCTLKIDDDILMWQFLTHVNNEPVAEHIVSLGESVDVVAEAYASYEKQQLTAHLADSITGILSPIYNSPTKQKEKITPAFSPSRQSPRRKIENDLSELKTPANTMI